MEELPNGWTWEAAQAEAIKRLGEAASVTADNFAYVCGWKNTTVDLIARLIAQHEKPPVDPDLMLAREIAALVARCIGQINYADSYREGKFDNQSEMIAALKLLKERK